MSNKFYIHKAHVDIIILNMKDENNCVNFKNHKLNKFYRNYLK